MKWFQFLLLLRSISMTFQNMTIRFLNTFRGHKSELEYIHEHDSISTFKLNFFHKSFLRLCFLHIISASSAPFLLSFGKRSNHNHENLTTWEMIETYLIMLTRIVSSPISCYRRISIFSFHHTVSQVRFHDKFT